MPSCLLLSEYFCAMTIKQNLNLKSSLLWNLKAVSQQPGTFRGHRGGSWAGPLTSVMSREAAAALMWRLGCRTELLQSRARANVPTALWERRGG